LDVAPVITKSVELARQCFPARYGGLPVILYDTSHHGDFAGFVVPFEEFIDEGGINSKLEARISCEGKPDKNGVVSHTDLSRVHLSVYARRSFYPRGYKTFLKSVPKEARGATKVTEMVNVSFRWELQKGSNDLWYQAWWNLPETQFENFDFHDIRSTYWKSFPCEISNPPATKRRALLLPLSPTLNCLPSGKGFDELRKFLHNKLGGSPIIPAVGIAAVQNAFPNFPEPPRKLARQHELPAPDEAPDYLFGKVLPYLKKFVGFEDLICKTS